jgi:hypothetical protein
LGSAAAEITSALSRPVALIIVWRAGAAGHLMDGLDLQPQVFGDLGWRVPKPFHFGGLLLARHIEEGACHMTFLSHRSKNG